MGDAVRGQLDGERIVAPELLAVELLDVEVLSAWRSHEAEGRPDSSEWRSPVPTSGRCLMSVYRIAT